MSVSNSEHSEENKEGLLSNGEVSNKIIEQISIENDNEYFGDLNISESNKDPEYHNNKHWNSEGMLFLEEEKQDLRRSQRRITRQSFAGVNHDHFHNLHDAHEDDEYRLLKWWQYEEGVKPQPLLVYVSFQSLLIMNIHSHLFSNEIIGFWAGQPFTHKNGKPSIYIHDVYPVAPIEDTCFDRSKSVEMDPEGSEIARKLIESRDQKLWAWYHSHPIFETNPSQVDIRNQDNYQKMFSKDKDQPFVGFIVGPYSPKLNSWKVVSEFTCFYLSYEEGTKPYELKVQIVPQKKIHKRVVEEIKDIFKTSLGASDQVNLADKWKGKMTRHEKFRKWIKMLINKN